MNFEGVRTHFLKYQPRSQGSLLPALGCRKVYFRSLTWWLNSRLSNHAYDVGYKFDKHGWRKVGDMTFLQQVLQLKLRGKMSLLLLYTFLKCWILFLFIAEVLVGGARGVRNSFQVFAIRSVIMQSSFDDVFYKSSSSAGLWVFDIAWSENSNVTAQSLLLWFS